MDTDLHVVYQKKHFVIYKLSPHSFLVHNTKKDLEKGSTSIRKFKIAKDVLRWALYQTVPDRPLSPYILRGLIRISDSKDYTKQITSYLKSKH